jgi:hypothetical protein
LPHHQPSLFDEPVALDDAKPQRTPWHFESTSDVKIEQSLDRCPDCQGVLVIRERVGTSPWSVIYRVTKAEHAEECVARNPTRANIERAIMDAYARNEPLAVMQTLEALKRDDRREALRR